MPRPDQIQMSQTQTEPDALAARAFSRREPSRRGTASTLTPIETLNIALRGVMELGIVVALGVWGYHTEAALPWKLLLTVLAPLLGFGFWGAIDFHQAGKLAEPLRLVQELAISVLAALALIGVGLLPWALGMLVLSVAHHTLVYALGQRLINER